MIFNPHWVVSKHCIEIFNTDYQQSGNPEFWGVCCYGCSIKFKDIDISKRKGISLEHRDKISSTIVPLAIDKNLF